MSGFAPPIKPPRGVKQQPRETSGLLMSVIRTLSASESNEQRDREKAKLEKEYKRSDKKLDELVSVHDEDLTQVMQLFEKLSSRVIASRDKIHCVKENLIACKMLLRCKRDELKKLWLEGIEHKHVLYLLEEIDKVREVPVELASHLSKKHYLHATKLLVTSLETAEGTLNGVDALRDVRADLQNKKEQLHSTLMLEVNQQLYSQPSTQAAALRRQGSGVRGSGRAKQPIRRGLEVGPSSQTKSALLHPDEAYASLTEDTNEENPDQRPEQFLAILVESLAMLGKLPDAVESLKCGMQPEMMAIVFQTTTQVMSLSLTQGGSLLLELLLTIFDQFRAVANAHAVALQCLRRAAEKYRINIRLYAVADVWAKLQAVLQQVLTSYLDIPNTTGTSHQAPSSFTETANSDLSTFFARRKPQKPKKIPLFKFDSSSNALTINNYLKEGGEKENQNGGLQSLQNKNMVCPADPWNITAVFITLSKFVEEIEQATGMQETPCTLRTFLADFVHDVFLGRQHVLLASRIEQATKAPDAWRGTISSEMMQELNLQRPLLQSTFSVQQCVSELQQLMTCLPSYAEHFLALACNMLKGYRETCQAAYRGIVQPDAEDKRVFSAAWLKDDDISRFLKSLPNWTDLQAQRIAQRQLGRYMSTEEESPEEIRQRNLREAEILAGNLGEGAINAHEILSDVLQLKGLAQLQESMEWFAMCLATFASSLPRLPSDLPNGKKPSTNCEEIPPLPAATVDALAQLANQFEDLGNTCLLVLHLEVRVQCFHYLLPRGTAGRATNGTESDDLDPRVLQLSRAITSIDEALASALQPSKAKYVFEGLGHLIAKILITSAQTADTIDEAVIQKICRNILSLQQTLATVTMVREAGLDHARHYFELFYLTPEELLGTVMEKGPQFSELEYMSALQLLHRSRGDPGTVNLHLKRLSDILGEVGVTV